MSLSPRQSALIRASLPTMRAEAAPITEMLNRHLGRHAPAMPLACGSAARTRLRRVIDAMLGAAELMHMPEKARGELSLLAHSMRAWGMSPRHYAALQAALHDTLAEHLGRSGETEIAWGSLMDALLAFMIADAYGPRRSALSVAA